nr:2'-5' RNA ligase family protein [Streptomyces gossypiisoli]
MLAEHGDKLGIVPEDWLHMTVQGIHHPVNAAQMHRLRGALRVELASARPFKVQLGPVWPGVTAVTVAVYPEDEVAALNVAVRTAAEKVPGITLRTREDKFWAHTSVAYGRDPFPDRDLNRALRALRPPRVDVTIDRVHLVNQYQHPDRGYYTWEAVDEFQLDGGRMSKWS